MDRKYKTGSRVGVLRQMAAYAIRDQEALIDALTPAYGDIDKDTAKAISDAEDSIKDFRRLAKSMSAL